MVELQMIRGFAAPAVVRPERATAQIAGMNGAPELGGDVAGSVTPAAGSARASSKSEPAAFESLDELVKRALQYIGNFGPRRDMTKQVTRALQQ